MVRQRREESEEPDQDACEEEGWQRLAQRWDGPVEDHVWKGLEEEQDQLNGQQQLRPPPEPDAPRSPGVREGPPEDASSVVPDGHGCSGGGQPSSSIQPFLRAG